MNEQPAILSNYRLSDPQRAAALARGGDVAVTAGAGTGKTRTLVARYLALLADGLPLRRIVAVTFTRKAAREMRNRVRREIGEYLRQPALSEAESQLWDGYYNELDAARINTIHNLCAEILRAHPAEAAVDPRFTILDETRAPLLVEEAVQATLAWAVDEEEMAPLFALLREEPLLDLITTLINQRFAAERIFARFPAEDMLQQWQAGLEREQEAVISGLQQDPEFRAAHQVLRESRAHNPQDRAAVQQQQALAALAELEVESLDGQLRALADLGAINLVGGAQSSWPGGKEQLAAVKAALRTLREAYRGQPILGQRLNAQDEAIAAAMPAIQRLFLKAKDTYEAVKETWEGLDFDDLEYRAIKLLEKEAAVRGYWQSQVQALLVDEFQDTNEQQRHFLRLLCPAPGRLFIVGDAKQSIYRFRGADVTVFAREKGAIAKQNGALIDLDTSYRAHETLLEGLNTLLGPVLGGDRPDRPPWVAPFAPLRPGTKALQAGLAPPFVEFHLAVGSKAEALPRTAAAVAGRLRELHTAHGLEYGAMAVLCRASNAFQAYEDAFDAAGIPYLTVAGKGFYDRPEIRDLINALTAIADPHDDIALTGLLRSPACGLSDVSIYQLSLGRADGRSLWRWLEEVPALADEEEEARLQRARALIEALNGQAGRVPVADILKRFLDRTYYRAGLRRAGQPRALRNVAKLLHDIHTSELVSIEAFLEYLGALRDSGSREGEARATAGGAVQIMSIHAAKGLEFPLVVLGDAGSASRGSQRIAVNPQLGLLLPFADEEGQRATSYELGAAIDKQQEAAETDRLLYVALTRAEQMLLVSGHMTQKKSGEPNPKGWLEQLSAVAGLLQEADWSSYDEAGAGCHTIDCEVAGTAVRATLYEPYFEAPAARPPAPEGIAATTTAGERPLQEPLAGAGANQTEEEEPTRPVWQVIPAVKGPWAPARLIGIMVHEALARWTFPGPGFKAWARARATQFGLTDEAHLRHAEDEVRTLLNRFQTHALYHRVEAANRRWHELPFSYEARGAMHRGSIDLLFEDADGWVLVDFKTDHVVDEEAWRELLHEEERGYKAQLEQYGRAVEQLLGVTPRLVLCLLDYRGKVKVQFFS